MSVSNAGIAFQTKAYARLLAFSCALSLCFNSGRCQAQDKLDMVNDIFGRVSAPTPEDMHIFEESGMTGVRQHTLTPGEQAKLKAALARLPALNLQALNSHLHHFAFVDGIPGEGAGLTGPAVDKTQYDMTFRASLFDETLSDFLTRKDNFVFAKDDSGVVVTITGTGTDALTYVLLHESTHVLDLACGFTASSSKMFRRYTWTSDGKLVEPLSRIAAVKTHFRGKPTIPLREAPALYASLAKSPFVSFYSTASPQEDLAELVAHQQISANEGGDFTVSVVVPGHQGGLTWRPLTFPAVQARLARIRALERLNHGCPTS